MQTLEQGNCGIQQLAHLRQALRFVSGNQLCCGSGRFAQSCPVFLDDTEHAYGGQFILRHQKIIGVQDFNVVSSHDRIWEVPLPLLLYLRCPACAVQTEWVNSARKRTSMHPSTRRPLRGVTARRSSVRVDRLNVAGVPETLTT